MRDPTEQSDEWDAIADEVLLRSIAELLTLQGKTEEAAKVIAAIPPKRQPGAPTVQPKPKKKLKQPKKKIKKNSDVLTAPLFRGI